MRVRLGWLSRDQARVSMREKEVGVTFVQATDTCWFPTLRAAGRRRLGEYRRRDVMRRHRSSHPPSQNHPYDLSLPLFPHPPHFLTRLVHPFSLSHLHSHTHKPIHVSSSFTATASSYIFLTPLVFICRTTKSFSNFPSYIPSLRILYLTCTRHLLIDEKKQGDDVLHEFFSTSYISILWWQAENNANWKREMKRRHWEIEKRLFSLDACTRARTGFANFIPFTTHNSELATKTWDTWICLTSYSKYWHVIHYFCWDTFRIIFTSKYFV